MEASSRLPSRPGVFWIGAVVVVVLAGIAVPPLGAALGFVFAGVAHRQGRADMRFLGLALAVVFVVLGVVTGVLLLDVEGGDSVTER